MALYDSIKKKLTLYDKPEFATVKGWREWNAMARSNQPFAYWLHEVFLDGLDTFRRRWVTGPINDARYWIRMRFFDRYNVIRTGLDVGYWDCDTRMLHGMFNMLVDFVEVEKAWMNVVFSEENRGKYRYPWWSLGYTRFKAFRCPEAGLDHLRWEMGLDDPNLPIESRSDTQAAHAREIMALYDWWKNVRPNRPDPMETSGWSAHCDRKREALKAKGLDQPLDFLDDEDETEEDKKLALAIIHKTHEIEKAYDDEDEAMLIRLIKIRKGLWT